MSRKNNLLALDVGEKRIGAATADLAVRIAVPLETIEVDGQETDKIARMIVDHEPSKLVIGYPRNQSGETTAQTEYVEQFAKHLQHMDVAIVFQDESLTSVLAEQQLQASGKPYSKGDVDAQAAVMILNDYVEGLNL